MKRLSALAIRASCLAIIGVAIIAGVVWNVRFAIADFLARRNQPDSTRLAMRVMPANGAYPAQLADEVYAMDPASAKQLLRRAVTLNRYDASSWIQLGLLSEAGNDLAQAEEALLRAAGVDSTFLPSWSLANFYFRQGNTARFWYWAQRAVQMAPDDATPLFRMAWYVNPSAAEIENRLQMNNPLIEAQFVNFLTTQGNAESVAGAASHLLAAHGKQGADTLLGVCDWLIQQQRPDLALSLWNGLAARGQIPYSPLAAGSTDVVTNGDFGKSPVSRGFDWHLATVEGVSSFLNASPTALGFEFSGEEPDNFLLMSQAVPVEERKNYALSIEYATSGISPGSGITWQVSDARSGAVLARTTSLSAEQGGKTYSCFTVPDGAAFVNLSLRYQRQPGTVRIEGKLALKEVRLARTAGEASGNACGG